MAADFPASITTLFSDAVAGQVIDVDFANRLKEEVIAIETEFGTSPKGTYADVKTKLNQVDYHNLSALTFLDSSDIIPVYDASATSNKGVPFSGLWPGTILDLNTFAGYGSTDTYIPYFSNVVTDTDVSASWTYVNNSTNGLRITIDKAGVYAFFLSWNAVSGSTGYSGLSLNSTQLTTNIFSINVTHRKALDSGASQAPMSCSWIGKLAASDILRVHTDANNPNDSSRCHFAGARLW